MLVILIMEETEESYLNWTITPLQQALYTQVSIRASEILKNEIWPQKLYQLTLLHIGNLTFEIMVDAWSV